MWETFTESIDPILLHFLFPKQRFQQVPVKRKKFRFPSQLPGDYPRSGELVLADRADSALSDGGTPA